MNCPTVFVLAYFCKTFFLSVFLGRFNRVFDQECRQDEVFEEVAQGVIDKYATILETCSLELLLMMSYCATCVNI